MLIILNIESSKEKTKRVSLYPSPQNDILKRIVHNGYASFSICFLCSNFIKRGTATMWILWCHWILASNFKSIAIYFDNDEGEQIRLSPLFFLQTILLSLSRSKYIPTMTSAMAPLPQTFHWPFFQGQKHLMDLVPSLFLLSCWPFTVHQFPPQ